LSREEEEKPSIVDPQSIKKLLTFANTKKRLRFYTSIRFLDKKPWKEEWGFSLHHRIVIRVRYSMVSKDFAADAKAWFYRGQRLVHVMVNDRAQRLVTCMM
jgi:hypothetical protein